MIWNRKGKRVATTVLVMVVSIAMLAWTVGVSSAAATGNGSHCAVLKVPSHQYPTIQSAINAASPCDTILVAPGTYVEQLTIDKSVSIIGSGPGSTIIQSPAVVTPDVFGNPWMIELGGGATVAISGVTVLETLQCIIAPGPQSPTVFISAYAGGAIGVGGSAYLNLQSAVVTTTGGTEGAACGGPSPTPTGVLSYGDGIAFGLDYVVGSPPASALLGFGQVTGVTISGFGYDGEPIGLCGHVNSPAGSSALISYDRVMTSSDDVGWYSGIDLGASLHSCSATIVHNVVIQSSAANAVTVAGGSSAYIAYNSISVVGEFGLGVFVNDSSATIVYNSIISSTTNGGFAGVFVLGSGASVTLSYNIIGQFECAYNAALLAAGLCGSDYLTEYQFPGILEDGSGTVVATHNQIYDNDAGIELDLGCSPNCVVQDNAIANSYDYGLMGVDGSYSFGPNLVVGGAYGVAAVAYSVDTTVALSHVVIVGPSVAPLYYEVDFSGGTATITGSWIVLP